jgi:hypothetical protein
MWRAPVASLAFLIDAGWRGIARQDSRGEPLGTGAARTQDRSCAIACNRCRTIGAARGGDRGEGFV